jgi:hypothetical protein
MNVPAKANVRMLQMLRKKFALVRDVIRYTHLMKLVARVEDDRREEKVEEDGIFERDHTLNHHSRTHPDNQSHDHA